jgi:hypothetical protein
MKNSFYFEIPPPNFTPSYPNGPKMICAPKEKIKNAPKENERRTAHGRKREEK